MIVWICRFQCRNYRAVVLTTDPDITAKGSLLGIRAFYSIFVPEIRPELRVIAIMTVLPYGLWIGSIWMSWPVKAALILPAIIIENFHTNILSVAAVQRITRLIPRKEINLEEFEDRLRDFFLIILGEGTARIIQGSPLEYGITLQSASGVLALVLYHSLAWILFTGDQTRIIVPAIYRDQRILVLFKVCVLNFATKVNTGTEVIHG